MKKPDIDEARARASTEQVSFDELKARVPLERVLREMLQWQPDTTEGDELRGSCPICGAQGSRGKKSRSFAANTKKNRFYCHACRKNGSIIDLVMHTQNISAKEAGIAINNFFAEKASGQDVVAPVRNQTSAVTLLRLELLEVRQPQQSSEFTLEPVNAVELLLLARVHPDLLRSLPQLALPAENKKQS